MEQFTKHVERQFQGQETTTSCQPLRRTPRLLRPCVDLHHPRRLPAPLRHDLMRQCTGRGQDAARDRRLRQPEHRKPPRSKMSIKITRHRTACRPRSKRWRPTRAAPTATHSEPEDAGRRRQVSGLCPPPPDLRRGLVDIALCWVMSDAGLRRSKTDASPRTVYLTPIAMAHLDAIRLEDADGSEPVFGLSESSISRRVKAAARPAWGPATAAIPGGSGWHGAWRRDAGKAPVWSPTTPGLKTPNAPPNGWGRSVPFPDYNTGPTGAR